MLIDEVEASRAAQGRGLAVLGCAGVLEDAFRSGLLADLRQAYRKMLASGAYIGPKIGESSLKALSPHPCDRGRALSSQSGDYDEIAMKTKSLDGGQFGEDFIANAFAVEKKRGQTWI